jgi:hypothetical protein
MPPVAREGKSINSGRKRSWFDESVGQKNVPLIREEISGTI